MRTKIKAFYPPEIDSKNITFTWILRLYESAHSPFKKQKQYPSPLARSHSWIWSTGGHHNPPSSLGLSSLPSSTSTSPCDQRSSLPENPSRPLPQFHPPSDSGIYIAPRLWEHMGTQPMGAGGDYPDTFSCSSPAISVPSTGGPAAPNRKACLAQGTEREQQPPPLADAKVSLQPGGLWSCLWMGCVSAGGRNSGNVKLQGSPLWRIKAHDSHTRAIATVKAKPHKEQFLPPHKRFCKRPLSWPARGSTTCLRGTYSFLLFIEKNESMAGISQIICPRAEDWFRRWLGTGEVFLQWIQFPTVCKGYFPLSPRWILSQASYSE